MIGQTIGQTPTKGSLVEAIYEKDRRQPLVLPKLRSATAWLTGGSNEIRRIPEVLRARSRSAILSTVSSAARDLLSLGSLIGSEFKLAVIRAASAIEAETVTEPARGSSEFAGVLQRIRHSQREVIVFVHEFVREALCDTITGAKRARLHGRIAEALETLYERGVDVDLADIAHHFVEGAAVGHAAKALEYCQRAAEHASQRQTFHESSRLFQMVQSALALQSSCGEPSYRRDRGVIDRGRASDGTGLAIHECPRRVSALADRNAPAEGLPDFKKNEGLSQNGGNLREHTAIGDSEEQQDFSVEAQLDSHRIQTARAQVTHNDEPEDVRRLYVGNGHSETRAPKNPATVIPSEKIFRREGEYWTIAYEGKMIRLRHSKGLAYIAHLMAHAGREFHVSDLSILGQCGIVPGRPAIGAETNGLPHEFGDAGPELDPSAKSSYRQRVYDLRDELREAKSFNDLGRIANIETEIEFISRELARAVGLGGRDRRASSDTERARLRVTMAVKSAVKKIAKQHPSLGRRLTHSLRTGNFCSFEPEPPSDDLWQM